MSRWYRCQRCLCIQQANVMILCCHLSTRGAHRLLGESLVGRETKTKLKLILNRLCWGKFGNINFSLKTFLSFQDIFFYVSCITKILRQLEKSDKWGREPCDLRKHKNILAQVLCLWQNNFSVSLSLSLSHLLLASFLYPTVKFNWNPDLMAIKNHLGWG